MDFIIINIANDSQYHQYKHFYYKLCSIRDSVAKTDNSAYQRLHDDLEGIIEYTWAQLVTYEKQSNQFLSEQQLSSTPTGFGYLSIACPCCTDTVDIYLDHIRIDGALPQSQTICSCGASVIPTLNLQWEIQQ